MNSYFVDVDEMFLSSVVVYFYVMDVDFIGNCGMDCEFCLCNLIRCYVFCCECLQNGYYWLGYVFYLGYYGDCKVYYWWRGWVLV